MAWACYLVSDLFHRDTVFSLTYCVAEKRDSAHRPLLERPYNINDPLLANGPLQALLESPAALASGTRILRRGTDSEDVTRFLSPIVKKMNQFFAFHLRHPWFRKDETWRRVVDRV